jgi:hypothetical protein
MPEGEGTGEGTPTPEAGAGASEGKSFTQEQVNAFVAAERHKGSEKIGQLTKERDDLAAFKASADKFRADAEKEIGSAKHEALRYSIALDKGLPRAVAERLVGDDAEALTKDADTLAELLAKPAPEGRLAAPPEGGTPDGGEQDMNAMIRRKAGRG